MKYLLFAFNFVFWIAGIAVMAVGIFTRVSAKEYSALMAEGGFENAANIMIAAGALVMIIGFVGCCGAIRENKWLLLLYFFLVLLIFILEIAGGIIAYTHRAEVVSEIEKMLNTTLNAKYGESSSLTKAMDHAQTKLKCCGVDSYKNWKRSAWATRNKNSTVPSSCCKDQSVLGCNAGITDANANTKIYTEGCSDAFQKFVKEHMVKLGGIGVGIAIIQILGMVFSLCLFRSIGYEKI